MYGNKFETISLLHELKKKYKSSSMTELLSCNKHFHSLFNLSENWGYGQCWVMDTSQKRFRKSSLTVAIFAWLPQGVISTAGSALSVSTRTLILIIKFKRQNQCWHSTINYWLGIPYLIEKCKFKFYLLCFQSCFLLENCGKQQMMAQVAEHLQQTWRSRWGSGPQAWSGQPQL